MKQQIKYDFRSDRKDLDARVSISTAVREISIDAIIKNLLKGIAKLLSSFKQRGRNRSK